MLRNIPLQQNWWNLSKEELIISCSPFVHKQLKGASRAEMELPLGSKCLDVESQSPSHGMRGY